MVYENQISDNNSGQSIRLFKIPLTYIISKQIFSNYTLHTDLHITKVTDSAKQHNSKCIKRSLKCVDFLVLNLLNFIIITKN